MKKLVQYVFRTMCTQFVYRVCSCVDSTYTCYVYMQTATDKCHHSRCVLINASHRLSSFHPSLLALFKTLFA